MYSKISKSGHTKGISKFKLNKQFGLYFRFTLFKIKKNSRTKLKVQVLKSVLK